MKPVRRTWLAAAVAAAALAALPAAAPLRAQGPSGEPWDSLRALLDPERGVRRAAARRLEAGGDRSLIPPLVDAYFFVPSERRRELARVLEALTGERFERYYGWVEWVGAHGEIEPPEGYEFWKGWLLAHIDPEYGKVFYPGVPARIRLEEVVSGGVRLAGIPALDNPATIAAAEAEYLQPGERVFGVVVGGEARAYPLRILSWHELMNDVVGGEPVTLSYCTLCGSGILYSGRTAAGGAVTFDTSGLLYRSNKLMVDRQSYTLWSNLTGEAVIGRRARAAVRLEMLPATVTTWDAWRRRHPATRALDLEALREVGLRHGFDYRPGAADRARRGVAFPVWRKSGRLDRDAEVYALAIGAAARAYPLAALLERRVVHDELGGVPLVLVVDPEAGAVRAYRRGAHRFTAAGGRLLDGQGRAWTVGEARLEPPEPEIEPLPRIAGHVAFWFGWFGFYPHTDVWSPDG